MKELGNVESVIGPSLVVKGDIHSSGTLQVSGVVEGMISGDGTIIIAEGGMAKANVTADRVVIGGTIEGNVVARRKAEILPTGILNGDLTTIVRGLVVREGANFDGVCTMGKTDEQGTISKKKRPHQEGKHKDE